MKRQMRLLLLTATLAVSLALPAWAQTTVNSTTLAAALSETNQSVRVLSVTNVTVGDTVFIDREAMKVRAISSPILTVARGQDGTVAAPHVNFSVVWTGVPARFYASDPKPGTCVRGSDGAEFLPHIVTRNGNAWDCPVGVLQTWQLLNTRGVQTMRTVWLDLGNAGATVNDVMLTHPRPININSCRAIYVEATSGTVAQASVTIGTLINTGDIVAATVYENTKAVGANTALTVNTGQVSANSPIHVRHVGVGTAQAGQAFIECEYEVR